VIQLILLGLVALSGVFTGELFGGGLGSMVGLGLMMAGAALVGRGLMDLGYNLTPLPYPRDDSELVQTGIYALVRHPLYGGLVLTAFGWGLVVASMVTLALTLVLLVFFDLKTRREEVWLRQRYKGYADYASHTRRLIPWVY
jgi:protein-S-isoprenylcysteine O-methyltransferase Ste14